MPVTTNERDPKPERREPKPTRERAPGRQRPPQPGQARSSSQPAGLDATIKKYWWVGALGAAGFITLLAVSRR